MHDNGDTMHRSPKSAASRYAKCRVLAVRGATPGERAAGTAASYRMWCRYDTLRGVSPFDGADGAVQILDALYGLWDNKENGYAEGTDTLELRWWLSGLGADALRDALTVLRARRSAGHIRGVYHGPKINFVESDLKMLNCVEWPLTMAMAMADGMAHDEMIASLAD